ncbi:MAG TPA: PEGA domain-containing protein [Methanocorpusculum sp.]|nr:PEGA domain-containing protein [Methanocorpusculum sp.]
MDCPFCGETVADDTAVCPQCGFPFIDTAPVPESVAVPSIEKVFRKKEREKTPLFIIILIIAGILLTAGGIAAFALDAAKQPASDDTQHIPGISPAHTPKPDVAYLTITSEPAGASVFIGGINWGMTPVSISVQPSAKYAVFIEMEGYETVFESVTLKNGEQKTLNVVFDESNRLQDETHTICGTWKSVYEVPDLNGNSYTLFYDFAEDKTGNAYWYQDGRTINICPFTWVEKGTRHSISYAGGNTAEEVTLSRDGSYLVDGFGYSYRRTDSLPSISIDSGSHSSAPENDEYARTFTWKSCGYTWDYMITFPKYRYAYYASQPRYLNNFLHYTAEPYNRQLAKQIAADILSHTADGFSDVELVKIACGFVQSIPYVSDLESTGQEEYYRYPVETLHDGCADCEDTSILLAAILKEMGCDVVLIRFDDHMGIGINTGDERSGAYWEYDGKEYFYLETTAEGFGPGAIPDELLNKKAQVIYVE